jgi:two-component system, NtrC family, response regulator PilR
VRKRLLIVEDEAAILNALALFFGNQGYAVDTALERADAESLLAERRYDAVLADLRLGGSSDTGGLELVSLARARCPGIRIVLLTAYGSAEIEQEAWRRGIDAFLHKPQPLSAIAAVVASLLQGG